MALSSDEVTAAVKAAMEEVPAIDLHTHLFPPSHGNLLLWGIDDLLTYHYLVSEFFMVAPGSITHVAFFELSRSAQADLVWEHLFRLRTPISEAQIGVLTTLRRLGLNELLLAGEIGPIRAWFGAQDAGAHAERIFVVANVRYVVMTNIPFVARECEAWVASPASRIDVETRAFAAADVLEQTYDKSRFKTALRVDPLLSGDWGTIAACITARGLPATLEGARIFLEAWAKVSVLLCTVTFYANHAHNLTRSP
jgi:hypothetical protein